MWEGALFSGKIYTADKNFTQLTVATNSKSAATPSNTKKISPTFASAWLSVTMEGVTQCCPVPPMDPPNLDRIALFPILSTADTIPTDARVHCLRRCETDSQRHCLASDLHHDFNFKPSCLDKIIYRSRNARKNSFSDVWSWQTKLAQSADRCKREIILTLRRKCRAESAGAQAIKSYLASKGKSSAPAASASVGAPRGC